MQSDAVKKATTGVLLLILSIVLALVLSEILLRFFYSQQPLYIFDKDLFMDAQQYGYCLRPLVEKSHYQPDYSYKIKTNSYGFRGREPDFQKKFKVLVLGDSFGMGQGVEEGKNLCELAQSYFDDQALDIGIFNTSVSGYSGINQLKVLNRFIDDYKPGLVVLLFSWNDLEAVCSLSVQNGFLVLNINKDDKWSVLREWFNTHSRLYCLLKNSYYKVKNAGFFPRATQGVVAAEDLQTALSYLAKIQDVCLSRQVLFKIVLFPLDESSWSISKYLKAKNIFVSQLQDNSLDFSDWASFLPEQGRKELFYKNDSHLTEKGCSYFARYLIQLIQDNIAESGFKKPKKERR